MLRSIHFRCFRDPGRGYYPTIHSESIFGPPAFHVDHPRSVFSRALGETLNQTLRTPYVPPHLRHPQSPRAVHETQGPYNKRVPETYLLPPYLPNHIDCSYPIRARIVFFIIPPPLTECAASNLDRLRLHKVVVLLPASRCELS